ncbi:hypothetical protein HK098_005853 [Nowakowskiella sp. JEL0407]|nr:hypothetical protein HK098_005853 [Nowakowskiella sp. JEL0407]
MSTTVTTTNSTTTMVKSQPHSHLPNVPPRDFMPNFEHQLEATAGNKPFALADGLTFMAYGAKAIAQDEFSLAFKQKPRTQFSIRLLLLPWYCAAFLFRYFFLFPYRITLLMLASVGFFLLLPFALQIKDPKYMRWLFTWYCQGFLRSFGSQIRYHGYKPKLNVPHVFVANHTSFVDWIVLSAHVFPHATIAQKHSGLLGFFLGSVLKHFGTLMFNRNEKNDRAVISKMIRDHVHDPSRTPLLIFPEGTCVNNEYTVLFHKGAFELDAVICPVAIKYNKRWADAYWASKNQTFTQHILYLMSRWAFVADVWYLPPMSKLENESSSDFANRVKALISKQAKLRNLSWDGYFKNYAPAKDKAQRMQEQPQNRFYAVIQNRLRDSTKKNTKQKYQRLRRSQSVCYGDLGKVPVHFHENPEWLHDSSSDLTTTQKNEILRMAQFNEDDPRVEMIKAIADKKNDVVETWKKYSKLKGEDNVQRRVENTSWRLWFKQRIELERLRQREERRKQQRRRNSFGGMSDFGDGDAVSETISAMVSSLWSDVASSLKRNGPKSVPSSARSTRSDTSTSMINIGGRSKSMVNIALSSLTSLRKPSVNNHLSNSAEEVDLIEYKGWKFRGEESSEDSEWEEEEVAEADGKSHEIMGGLSSAPTVMVQ